MFVRVLHRLARVTRWGHHKGVKSIEIMKVDLILLVLYCHASSATLGSSLS